jgi:DNA polymerase IV (DinB-like DNA polymerase)
VAKNRNRIIIHVDMDQFFAAVEEREHPEFQGKPVIVGADPKQGKGRGVVSTCNYEARKFGVKSGIPISLAWSLCPAAIFVSVNYRLYQKVSKKIMDILRNYPYQFEQWGLDEAFLDVSDIKNFEEATILAERIKKHIFEKVNLVCSVGVGPNKLIAKVASDFNKPDGLTIVKKEEMKAFLALLSVRKLLWVGKKTEERLKRLGIFTIGDLANYDANILIEKFGSMGNQLIQLAQGIDNSEVQEKWVRKSISREITFEEDVSDATYIFETIDALSKDLHKELIASKFIFKTITVKIRYRNFRTFTHSLTLPFFTDRKKDILKNAKDLVRNFLVVDKKIRLVGVRLSNLFSTKNQMKLIE